MGLREDVVAGRVVWDPSSGSGKPCYNLDFIGDHGDIGAFLLK